MVKKEAKVKLIEADDAGGEVSADIGDDVLFMLSSPSGASSKTVDGDITAHECEPRRSPQPDLRPELGQDLLAGSASQSELPRGDLHRLLVFRFYLTAICKQGLC